MEIKIDLNEILGDEYGDSKTLAQSIRRQIIDNLTKTLATGIQDKVNTEIAKLIDEQIKKIVECQMPSLFSELIDKEYDIVSSYGSRGGKTTMRNQLIKTLSEQMIYKAARYDSEKNYFTKNIDAVVSGKMTEFKKDFDDKVNETFKKEAFEYAIKKVGEKLGV